MFLHAFKHKDFKGYLKVHCATVYKTNIRRILKIAIFLFEGELQLVSMESLTK